MPDSSYVQSPIALEPFDKPDGANVALLVKKLSQAIANRAESDDLLRMVTALIGEAFAADGCLLEAPFQEEPASFSKEFYAQRVWYVGTRQGKFIASLTSFVIQKLLDTDCVVLDETDPSLAPIVSAWEESEAIGALLAVRTVCCGETNGAIALVRGRGKCWTDLEKEQLQEAATQAGIAIAQAQFKRKIQIHAQQQVAIDRLGQAMRRLDAPDRLFQIAVDAVRSALQVTRSSILLLQHSSEADVTTVSIGSDNMVTASGEPLPFAFDLSESHWYRQAVEQAPRTLAIANWQQAPFSPEPPFDPNYLPAFAAIPLMGAPTAMLEREEILGFLVLQHHHPRPWLAEELALAESVAGQLGAALLHHRMAATKTSLEERLTQLGCRIEELARLSEQIHRQMEQTQRFNRYRDDFLSSISHELRTPLTSMTLAIRLLRQPNLPSERRTNYLDILEQQCSQQIRLIEDLLRLRNLKDSQQISPPTTEILCLDEVTDLAIAPLQARWLQKRIVLVRDFADPNLAIRTHINSLKSILSELLTNAGKFAAPNTTVHLSATLQPELRQFQLTVTNIGRGIDPEDLPHIFEVFFRGAGVTGEAYAGTGLGLALVRNFVQLLGGKIEAVSEPLAHSPHWRTEFTLTLPQTLSDG